MPTEIRRDIFQAIADPNRRQIIDILIKEPMTLNAIAEKFDISRPAVSQHIKHLTECGVVEIEQKGRERYCTVQTESLIPSTLPAPKIISFIPSPFKSAALGDAIVPILGNVCVQFCGCELLKFWLNKAIKNTKKALRLFIICQILS